MYTAYYVPGTSLAEGGTRMWRYLLAAIPGGRGLST
jgi:hypothetical protein